MKKAMCLLTFGLIISSSSRLCGGEIAPFDQKSLSEAVRSVAPSAECLVEPLRVRVAYHVDKKSIQPELKDGSIGKQPVVVDVPQEDGWLIDVQQADHPYLAQVHRPDILDLAAANPGAHGPHYRTAVTKRTQSGGSIVIGIAFGEKADLNLVKKIYHKLATEIGDLPKAND